MKHWIYTSSLVVDYHDDPEEIDIDAHLSIEELAHELGTMTQVVVENLEVIS